MSNKKKDGGPAFPIVGTATDEDQMHRCYGMSLRDYLAAKAMAGMWNERTPPDYGGIAIRAYVMADAMLKAREQ